MPNDADLQFVRKLSAAANERGLHALLIGGHAVNAHGVSRFTEDFDFLISRTELELWKELLNGIGFAPFREASTFAQFSSDITEGPNRLDLMLVNQETFTKLSAKSLSLSKESESVRMVCATHLVALKLHVLRQDLEHRLRDFLDVVEVIKASRIDLQSNEMLEVFERYGTPDLYRRIKLACE